MTPDEYMKVAKTGRVYQLKLPMRIQSSKKKKTAMNLNVYRNLHFRSLSAQKNNFAKIAKKLLEAVPKLGTIALHYEVCPKTRRRLDTANVASIVDKYFSDCLTENGNIVDDNYEYVVFVSSGFGGLHDDEHVLVTITEIEPRKENPDMRILLDQADIQTALEAYVETQGIAGASGVELSVDGEEITAEVMMGADAPAKKAPVKRNKGGRPAGSKNKPKEETADVETPDESNADSGDGGADQESKTTTPVVSTEDAAPAAKAAGNSKNLFGDGDSQSSETKPETAKADSGEAAPKPVKKSSIFDQ